MQEEIFHHVEALGDGFGILQGEDDPSAEHPAAHCGDGVVDDVEQRHPLVLHRTDEFEGVNGEFVEPDIFLLLNA